MNTDILDLIKYIATILGAGTAVFSFLIKYRDDPEYKRKDGPMKKADYDLAIDALRSDTFLCALFEDLKKIAIIKLNTGIYLVPEEIESVVKFLKVGRISPDDLRRAWPHRKFKRDGVGVITELTFELSKWNRALRFVGNMYSLVLGVFALLCLFLFFISRDPSLGFLSIVLFGCVLISVIMMTGSLNSAARVDTRMREK